MPDMRRIGIDCRFASVPAGLGRYTRELVQELTKHPNIHFVLFVRSKSEDWIPRSGSVKIVETTIPHYSLSEQFLFPSLIKAEQLDLFFAPHFNVPLMVPCPFVATIHDLILHRFPNEASPLKKLAYRVLMRACMRRSKALIAVSEFTASEIQSFYGPQARIKTVVIPEGINPDFKAPAPDVIETVKRKYHLTKPFFLYVGNAKQHKNAQLLLKAFQVLGDTSKELILVTGGKEAKHLRLPSGARILSAVPDSELPALYASALCFVTASLYEGFCLPLLEARACGCPVIACNLSAIPENAGPDAVLIKPTIDALIEAMRSPPKRSEAELLPDWKEGA
ncbi:MAG TPA: glycosyltransferase family 1 protein, partial [Candidatus Peribacteraceae bacterium]|nr:glycosyltransferase family 1 protein [Candidatus Peribacteraceae bacterium]